MEPAAIQVPKIIKKAKVSRREPKNPSFVASKVLVRKKVDTVEQPRESRKESESIPTKQIGENATLGLVVYNSDDSD